MKSYIQSMGGKVTGSVSGKTDYLLIGENPGSKFDRAKELGVNVIGEQELRQMVSVDTDLTS